MIRSFADRDTERFFRQGTCPARWQSFARIAKRKLDMIDYAARLADLRSPPGNRLEALKGNHRGQYSIRINDQWRICFRWTAGEAEHVEITDYH
jgi:toxin HigB-1